MSKTFFVYGPPGTGKTTYLSRQAQRAAQEHGPEDVVIASLTRAAATEIAGRDTGIPDHNTGTLHAHAYRALDRPALAETPEGVRAWNDTHPHQSLSRGTNQLEDTTDPGSNGEGGGDTVHHQVMTLRARMIPRDAWTLEQRSHDADWTDWKQQTSRLDFTDLIEQCVDRHELHPALPSVLLLDEAQDFSRLELELARMWGTDLGKNGTMILVGDPDQAIYTWRGADPHALRDLQADDTRRLEQSYRVPEQVHRLAREWVRQITDRVDVAYRPTDNRGTVLSTGVALRQADQLHSTIRQCIGETDGTVMVLASCGYMLSPLIGALREHGVPFHNPYRRTDGRWNPMRGTNRLKAFLRADPRVWGDQARCWTWDDLRQWTDPLTAKTSLARGAKTLIEAKCAKDQFGETRAHDEVPDETLFQLLDSTGYRHPAFRGDTTWWASRLRAKEAKSAEYALQVLDQSGPEALRDDPRLIVGTIHSVKGGEADTVIVAPDLSVAGYWHGWHPGGPGRDQIIRMIYVALTRARERVILLAPSGPEHVPAELLEVGEAIAA